MVEWSREYYTDPATTGLNAVYRSSTEDAPEEQSTNDRTSRSGSTVVRTTDSGQLLEQPLSVIPIKDVCYILECHTANSVALFSSARRSYF